MIFKKRYSSGFRTVIFLEQILTMKVIEWVEQ